MSRPVESAPITTRLLGGKSPSVILTALGLLALLLASAAIAAAGTRAPAQSEPAEPAASIQQDSKSASLEPNKPIERELSASETHAYMLALAAGQYAEVVVAQRGINIVLSAFNADGVKIVEADMFFMGDSESISLIAETPTTYRLEVRATEKAAPKGRYEIKVKDLRAATEKDKSLIAIQRLVAEGGQFARQQTADSWRKAIEKYQQAIPLAQSAKDPAWEATALYLIGYTYISLGEKQKALDASNQALVVAQAAVKETDEERHRLALRVEANSLEAIGRVYIEFGDKKKALEQFNQSLPIRRESGDRVGEIGSLNNIGMAYGYMGDWPKALEFFNQSRLIASEVGDRLKEATILNNMCVIHGDLGEYQKAIDFCNQALSVRQPLNDPSGEAPVLNNMGTAYSSLGEYQKALDLYTRALAIHKAAGNLQSQAIALNNVGWVYGTLGEYQKAIDNYNEALKIVHDAGDQYREANVLGNIAVNYADMKDFRKALEINQRVLALRRAVNNREGEAITLNNIGGCYSNLGDKQKALDYYNQSIALHRTVKNPRQLASALKNIGTVYRDLGETQKALDNFNEALQMARAIGDRNNEAGILAHIALLERNRGNFAEGRKRIEEAIAAVESLRVNIKSQQLRASFSASVRNYHELDINLLMRLHKQEPTAGFDAAALQASEKGRARSLLELLTEAGAEIRQGADSSLVERERALRQVISDKANKQMRLLGGEHTESQAAAAAKEMDALTTEYEQVLAQIRQTSPRYAALTQPVPLSLKEIQSGLLDADTVLLEYALGEEKSFLWVVTPDSIKSFELPSRADIESAARKVYDLITEPDRLVQNESPEQRRKRLDRAEADYPDAATALSRILLEPAASELKDKRLLIVGEGVLQYVPFAALPEPAARADQVARTGGTSAGAEQSSAEGQTAHGPQQSEAVAAPLIVRHEIISLPSASVLEVLRREAKERERPPKTLAVFADPVFDTGDSRLAPVKSRPIENNKAAQPSEVRRSAEESGLNGFPRLRFSRQEAEQIMRLASKNQSLEALDFAASRAAALSSDLRQYRIVHFATHGLINNQHAELSGIVLSLVNEQGRPENGFVRLYDIYNMNLKADLVVLSACQTALGKEIKGEGLVGLTRAFMYAGASRVVASLWQTEDRSTAALMSRFYENMLGGAQTPAAALRSAQVSMWKDKRWRQPRYWAAFTLQGEWK